MRLVKDATTTVDEELHLMGSLVSDEDFAMIFVSSLLESWDLYISAS